MMAVVCEKCGCGDTVVKDSRPNPQRGSVRRKRECLRCGNRWFTLEVEENTMKRMEIGLDPRDDPASNKI